MRSAFLGIFVAYLLLVCACLARAIVGGMDIRADLPLLLATEPWSSLLGIFYVRFFGGYITDEFWDRLSVEGWIVVTISGAANALILWLLVRLSSGRKRPAA